MKGLTTNFVLFNGRFVLSDGAAKAKDSLYFLLLFNSIRKIYDPDFTTGLLFLVQKPISTITTYQTLILGKLKKTIYRYVPSIVLNSLSIDYVRSQENKDFALVVDYTYKETPETSELLVTFV